MQDWSALSWCLEGFGSYRALSSCSYNLDLKLVERYQLKTGNNQDVTLLDADTGRKLDKSDDSRVKYLKIKSQCL